MYATASPLFMTPAPFLGVQKKRSPTRIEFGVATFLQAHRRTPTRRSGLQITANSVPWNAKAGLPVPRQPGCLRQSARQHPENPVILFP
jgi:hypothetical protein